MIKYLLFLCLACLVLSAEDMFSGLIPELSSVKATNSTSDVKDENFFTIEKNSPMLLPSTIFSSHIEPAKEYAAKISGKKAETISNADLINILQEQVKKTNSQDPESLYLYGKTLLTLAYHSDYADQASAMLRTAQTQLLQAHKLYFKVSAKQMVFCREAEKLLEDFFAYDFIEVEKRTAQELQNQGRIEEANHLLRIINYKTENESSEIQAILAYTYGQLATQSSNPEIAANYANAANYYNNSSQKAPSLSELLFKEMLETSPEPSDQQIDSLFSNLFIGIRTEVSPEKQIDSSIKNALEMNQSGRYQEALEVLRASVKKSGFNAAKPRYFIARQYQLMANLPQFSSQKAEFLQTMNEHIQACQDLKNKHLSAYSENSIWADHAKEFHDSIKAQTEVASADPTLPSAAMVLPCSGRISSPYGMRLHPVYKVQRMHTGIDIGAPRYTPLVAMQNGKITKVGTNGGYGKAIEIVYDDGNESLYAHLDNYKGTNGTTQVGQRVKRGEKVGEVDSTGTSTGHHLHLEIKRKGTRIDPAIALKEITGKNIAVGTTL